MDDKYFVDLPHDGPVEREILDKAYRIRKLAPLKDKFFAEYGTAISVAITSVASLFVWRCYFRAFNLHRYGKGRMSSAYLAVLFPATQSLYYQVFVGSDIVTNYISQERWRYTLKAGLSQTMAMTIGNGIGCSFSLMLAHRYGTMALPDSVSGKENRVALYNILKTKFKPYRGLIMKSFAGSIVLMSYVGLLAFDQTAKFLLEAERECFAEELSDREGYKREPQDNTSNNK